jgi:exopolyphosphatase/guanosine-5'-triphosphate,3'-diphosphate pyrophosphatase
MVAEVNVCKGKVMRVLLDESKRVPYQEDFQKNGEKLIGPEVVKQGIAVLSEFKNKAMSLGAQRMAGYATSVFRKAPNGRDVTDEINRATRINVRVVTQEEEGQIGFRGVQALVEVPTSSLVVWDIGGGSQQLMMAESDKVSTFKGNVASVGFRDLVITQVKKEDPKKITTPNPLDNSQIDQAVVLAKSVATAMEPKFRARIQQPETVIVGIGGVHWNSIRSQTHEKDAYTKSDLEAAIRERADKTDAFFSSEYADTELTNLVLVYGFMNELGIEQVRPLKVNLALGALVDTANK